MYKQCFNFQKSFSLKIHSCSQKFHWNTKVIRRSMKRPYEKLVLFSEKFKNFKMKEKVVWIILGMKSYHLKNCTLNYAIKFI